MFGCLSWRYVSYAFGNDPTDIVVRSSSLMSSLSAARSSRIVCIVSNARARRGGRQNAPKVSRAQPSKCRDPVSPRVRGPVGPAASSSRPNHAMPSESDSDDRTQGTTIAACRRIPRKVHNLSHVSHRHFRLRRFHCFAGSLCRVTAIRSGCQW